MIVPDLHPHERVARINGSDLHYWVYREELGPTAETVLIVHGLRGTHHGLELIAAGLAGRRVVIPDLPGFGDSGPLTGRHDVAGYAEVIAELIDRLGGAERPIVLVGHSFGSIVASRLAASRPSWVHRLVLINPIATSALRGPHAALAGLTAAYYSLGERLPTRAGRSLLTNRWVVLGFAAFCAAMAASMLGAFEIRVPSALQTKLSMVGGKGYKGAFAMGLVSGLIAAPCTGPVLSVLLTFRAFGLLFSDVIVWPLVLAAFGVALLWERSRSGARVDDASPASPGVAPPPPAGQESQTRVGDAAAPASRVADLYRGVFGVLLVMPIGAADMPVGAERRRVPDARLLPLVPVPAERPVGDG